MQTDERKETGPILIVEDVKTNRKLLRHLLESEGYAVQERDTGEACLDYCARETPSLILLDIMMPDIDGFEVCRRLRDSLAKEQLPIIMVTARAEGRDLASGIESGANDYIVKPFERAELLARVANQIALVNSYNQIQLQKKLIEESYKAQRVLEKKVQQQVRLDTVNRFSRGVAHNFNNVLGGILCAANMLERSIEDTELRKHLSMIRDAVDKGASLTTKMSSVVVREDECKLIDANEIGVLLKNLFTEESTRVKRDINFQCSIKEDLLPVRMSKKNLTDILRGILSNAVDAINPDGQVRVTLSNGSSGHMVLICVEDDGVGISEENLERISEPFFSTKNIDSASGLSVHGAGLDLWNIYNLVKMYGGQLEISSHLGKGTKVLVQLPATAE